jgi:long-chain acyl-CoA synthetase
MNAFDRPKTPYSNNLVSSMRMNVSKIADQPAIVCGERLVTWKEMWSRTNQLGQALYGLGLKKGDRLGLLLNNCFEFAESFISATKSGFIVCPLNRYLKADELAYQLRDCGARAVITNPEYVEQLRSIRGDLPDLKHVIVTGDEAFSDTLSYEMILTESLDREPEVVIAPEDLHMILYTSGTTGRPKGAVRGYMENYHTAVGVCMEWKIRSGDVQLAVTPLYHAASAAWFLATLISGGTYVIMPQFEPEQILATIEKHRVNWLMMVPVMYDRLLKLPDEVFSRYDLGSLRTLVSGGAPLHTHTKLNIKKRFNYCRLYEFYGSTELGVSTSLRDEDQLRKERCVGRPMPDVELKILDPNGNEVPRGEIGLLYSRGLSGFRGYWNDPEKTAEAFLDGGWATVGDMARQDDGGYYYIVDRAKDMIISGGVNVYPVEVEEVIHQIPGVQDTAVIGVPDERWGEAVKAVVVLEPGAKITEAEIIAYCKERLAAFKVPKSVDFVEQIPRTQTGKILKRELRKKYWGDGDIQIS